MAPTTTFAPGDTIFLTEDYGSVFKAGDIGHVTESEPAHGNADELVHFVRTDGEACEGVYAFRLAPGLFEKGDRVAIESNVYTARGEHYETRMASVGDTGTVTTEDDEDGDVYVRLDKSERIVPIAASGLVYLGDTEPTDEEVAEQEALDEPAMEGEVVDIDIAALLRSAFGDDEDEDDYYPADLSRRADALALAYDVVIDAATKASDAGFDAAIEPAVIDHAFALILGDEEGGE